MIFRHKSSRKGQAAVEFIVAFAAFMVVFFFLADMVRLSFNWLGMQYATNRGIRMAKLLPTQMNTGDKTGKIQNEIIQAAGTMGIDLTSDNMNIAISGNNITVETFQNVRMSPISSLFTMMGGDGHTDETDTGVYNLRVREVVRNESL